MKFWNKTVRFAETLGLWFLGLEPSDLKQTQNPSFRVLNSKELNDAALLIEGVAFCFDCGCMSTKVTFFNPVHPLYHIPYHIPSDLVCSECGIRLAQLQMFSHLSETDQDTARQWLQ